MAGQLASPPYSQYLDSEQTYQRSPGVQAPAHAWVSEHAARSCNICSAAVSLVALIVVCVLAGVKPEATANLWIDSLVVLNDTNITRHVQLELWAQCGNSSGGYDMQVAEYAWNTSSDARAYMVPVPLAVGRVSVWPFLALVYFWSLVFQAANAWPALPGPAPADDESPAGCAAVDADPATRGPDFSRWAEYALTSPFQVFLVATTFFVGERNLLLCLAFLQGALVLLGYGIELVLHDVILRVRARDFARVPGLMWRALGLFVYAVAAHCVIWGVLVAQFVEIVRSAHACQDESGMPTTIIAALLAGQCILFSLFGGVVLFQLCWLALHVYRRDFDAMSAAGFTREFWLQTTIVYCGLSVSAKTFLAFLFVAVQYNMPRELR